MSYQTIYEAWVSDPRLEEIGMEFYAEYLRQKFGWTIPVVFIQSGDAYSYFPA